MKKLIFEYLNVNYPNLYIRKTKFGDVICGYDRGTSWLYVRSEAIDTIKVLFSCDIATADELVNDWIKSRPVFDRIRNSTNEFVLIPVLSNSETSTTYV